MIDNSTSSRYSSVFHNVNGTHFLKKWLLHCAVFIYVSIKIIGASSTLTKLAKINIVKINELE